MLECGWDGSFWFLFMYLGGFCLLIVH